MTVFIVFASGHVDSYVIDCLCAVSALEIIGYARDTTDAVREISGNKPQLLIIDSRGAQKETVELLRELLDIDLHLVKIVIENPAMERGTFRRGRDEMTYYFQFPDDEGTLPTVLAALGG